MTYRLEVKGRHRAPTKTPRLPAWLVRWRSVHASAAAGAAFLLVLALGAFLFGCRVTVDSQESRRETPTPSAPTTPPTPPAGPTLWPVAYVIDGDTIRLGTPGKPTESVRLIGINTPERGECGYEPAADYLRKVIGANRVTLTSAPGLSRDRHRRLLRYVSVHGVDLGLAQIQAGFAIARYDSRDGYRRHPRQDTYIAADEAAPPYLCEPTGDR